MPAHRTRRAFAVLAVLFGLLLLQGSLCGGSGGTAVPCVGSCDRAETSTADTPPSDSPRDDVTMAFAAQAPGNTGHGGLVNLCVTVLLAVIALIVMLSRPVGLLVLARPPLEGAPSTVPCASHRPVLCALRL